MSDQRSDGEYVLRNSFQRRLTLVMVVISAVLAVGFGAAITAALVMGGSVPAPVIGVAVLILVVGVVAARARRRRTVLDSEALTVVTTWKSRRIPWSRVGEVESERQPRAWLIRAHVDGSPLIVHSHQTGAVHVFTPGASADPAPRREPSEVSTALELMRRYSRAND